MKLLTALCCSVPGCTDAVVAKGHCPRHYRQQSRNRLGKSNEHHGPRETLSCSLDEDLVKAIRARAKAEGIAYARLLERLLTPLFLVKR